MNDKPVTPPTYPTSFIALLAERLQKSLSFAMAAHGLDMDHIEALDKLVFLQSVLSTGPENWPGGADRYADELAGLVPDVINTVEAIGAASDSIVGKHYHEFNGTPQGDLIGKYQFESGWRC